MHTLTKCESLLIAAFVSAMLVLVWFSGVANAAEVLTVVEIAADGERHGFAVEIVGELPEISYEEWNGSLDFAGFVEHVLDQVGGFDRIVTIDPTSRTLKIILLRDQQERMSRFIGDTVLATAGVPVSQVGAPVGWLTQSQVDEANEQYATIDRSLSDIDLQDEGTKRKFFSDQQALSDAYSTFQHESQSGEWARRADEETSYRWTTAAEIDAAKTEFRVKQLISQMHPDSSMSLSERNAEAAALLESELDTEDYSDLVLPADGEDGGVTLGELKDAESEFLINTEI